MRYKKVFLLLLVLLFSINHLKAQTCISLFSAPGTDNQKVCINSPIINIVYSLGPLVTGATVTGLPTGVTGSYSSGFFTIIGTPSVSGTFTYTVTTTGICSGSGFITGAIIVNTLPVPTLTSSDADNIFCSGTSVTFTAGGGTSYNFRVNGLTVQNSTANTYVTTTLTNGQVVDVIVTNSNGCRATSAGITNVVNPTPSATAASNSPVCQGTSLSLTGGPGAMIAYSWSGPNGYSNATQSPTVSSAATLAMSGTYLLRVTNSFACQDTASTKVVVNAAPVTTAVNNGPVCAGSPLNLTGGPGLMTTYAWTGPNSFTSALQSPQVSLSATPAMSGTYTLTATNSNGCKASAATTATVNIVPVATASNNGPVCAGTTLSLTGGPAAMSAYSWSGPNGFISNAQNPVVSANSTVAMAGVYTLTVTNSFGCQNTTTTTVIVNPVPVTTALNNGPVCAGAPLVLAGGPSGMTSYAWTGPNSFTSNIQNPTVSLVSTTLMSGVYTLTVVNANGCQNSASTTAVVNAIPAATAISNGPVCSGKPLTLTGGPAGMTSYSWAGPNSFTSNLQSPTVSLAATAAMSGIYTLTVTNSNGCQDTARRNVIVNQTPVATAINNSPLCVGTALNLTGGPAAMTTYSWTGPGSFVSTLMSPVVSPAATITMAGVYLLTVTNASGCQDTATTRARIYTVPIANAGLGGTECDLDFILNAVPSVGTGLWTIVTGPGVATFTPAPTIPGATVTVSAYGTYTFRWTETNGPCTSNAVVTVNFYQTPVANPGPGGNACNLEYILGAIPSAGIGTWTMTSGTGTAIFSPNANTPGATVLVSEYGAKQFTWTEVNGTCTNAAVITVNFYQQPTADAGGAGGNNCGFDYNLRAIPSIGAGTWTLDSGPGVATFSPDAISAITNVTVSAAGSYVFRWTEVNGSCSSSSSITINFLQQPRANGGSGGDECDLNFVLNAVPGAGTTGIWSKVSGPGTVTFSPNANQHNATVTASLFGSYDLAWTETNSQCSSTDIIRVTFHDLPQVNAGADAIICKGRSIQLNASGSGSFQWSPPATLNNPRINNPVATPAVSTLYTVTLTDPYGCVNTDQVNVEVRVQPVANAGPDQNLDFLFETDMHGSALGTNQTGTWTVLSGGSTMSDVHNPTTHVSDLSLDINSYIWTVTNSACPVAADTVNIIVNNLIIPTLITPNLDGNNDFFVIKGLESFGNTSLTVFNKWGGLVFLNKKYDNLWNGVDNDENPLPEDTYFFILKTEKSRTIKGYLVIRR